MSRTLEILRGANANLSAPSVMQEMVIFTMEKPTTTTVGDDETNDDAEQG